ncbi:hypothetical protein B0I35DRAFT_479443 [Stachybotrys elegans]|uniref:RRM domain-containing protein n=1 Tax=Stachybotrys elegans TaxID=80388 RepID=A0A8K0SPU4_9HYPO|nr:hypothetical protein B0I35DRAFT_479443 [Stachybotrys elegans]
MASETSIDDDASALHLPSGSSSIARDHRGLAMTALEIGVIVGTVLAFLLGIFFVFYCRQTDKNNSEGGNVLRRAEQGHDNDMLAIQEPIGRDGYAAANFRTKKPAQWIKAMMQKYGRSGGDMRVDIVVERLTKNINEGHLHELFGQFGPIADLDLPMNRSFGTNRGTAYILYDHVADAEAAIAHMHEAHVDGAMINVSIGPTSTQEFLSPALELQEEARQPAWLPAPSLELSVADMLLLAATALGQMPIDRPRGRHPSHRLVIPDPDVGAADIAVDHKTHTRLEGDPDHRGPGDMGPEVEAPAMTVVMVAADHEAQRVGTGTTDEPLLRNAISKEQQENSCRGSRWRARAHSMENHAHVGEYGEVALTQYSFCLSLTTLT